MTKIPRHYLLLCGLTVVSVDLAAQVQGELPYASTPLGDAGAKDAKLSPYMPDLTISESDAAWKALEINFSGAYSGGPGTAMQQPRFLDVAAQARTFREKYPDHPKAKLAKTVELRALLDASLFGGGVDLERVSNLLTALRGDQELPVKLRFELVNLSETVRNKSVASDTTALLSAQEDSARRLITEFPAEDEAYEMLLRVAQNHSDPAKRTALAAEVSQTRSRTPLGGRAKIIVDRQALVGKSLATIADTSLGKGNSISAIKGKSILVYTWSSAIPGTMADAKRIAATVPSNMAVIGVNLDEDSALAQNAAQSETLPGIQIYNAAGFKAPLVQALLFDASFPIYVVNSKGIIREVSAQTGSVTDKITAALN